MKDEMVPLLALRTGRALAFVGAMLSEALEANVPVVRLDPGPQPGPLVAHRDLRCIVAGLGVMRLSAEVAAGGREVCSVRPRALLVGLVEVPVGRSAGHVGAGGHVHLLLGSSSCSALRFSSSGVGLRLLALSALLPASSGRGGFLFPPVTCRLRLA